MPDGSAKTSANSQRQSLRAVPFRMLEQDGTHRYLYVIGCRTGFVKVGLATDPHQRLEQIQAHNPVPVELRFTREVPTMVAIWTEKQAHAALAKYHVHGEWFKTSTAIARLAIVAAIRDGWARADEMRERRRAILAGEARYRRDPRRKAEAIAEHHESERRLDLLADDHSS